jgi:hypothetical protein
MNTFCLIEFSRVKQTNFPLRVTSRSQADRNNTQQSSMSDSVQRTTMVDQFAPSIIMNPKQPINPYRKQPQHQASRNAQEGGGKSKKTLIVLQVLLWKAHDVVNMGIQSQNREGSVKAAMKKGGKNNFKFKPPSKQAAIDGGLAFDAVRDCIVCKARFQIAHGIVRNVPNRVHDKRCVRNRETKGMSARTVVVDKAAAKNLAANRAPIVAGPPPPAGVAQAFF